MLRFGHFISQNNGGLDIPVVFIDESFEDKIDTINEELDGTLSECLVNPYIGWVNASKILAPYNILLPKVLFKDIHEGEEVVALNLKESETEYYFYYNYNFIKEGYETFAVILTETELEELLEEE
jgi:hypothetical protein